MTPQSGSARAQKPKWLPANYMLLWRIQNCSGVPIYYVVTQSPLSIKCSESCIVDSVNVNTLIVLMLIVLDMLIVLEIYE